MKGWLYAALLIAALSAPSGAEIVVSEGDRESAKAVKVINQRVPVEFRNTRKQVLLRVVEQNEIDELTQSDPGSVLGLFFPDDNRLYVSKRTHKMKLFTHVVLHEYAHFVSDELVTDDERELFLHVWQALRLTVYTEREYRTVHPEEGLAEALAYHWAGDKKSDRLERVVLDRIKLRLRASSTIDTFDKKGDEDNAEPWTYRSESGGSSSRQYRRAGEGRGESGEVRGGLPAERRYLSRRPLVRGVHLLPPEKRL